MNYFNNERLEQNVLTNKYACGTTSVDGNTRYKKKGDFHHQWTIYSLICNFRYLLSS